MRANTENVNKRSSNSKRERENPKTSTKIRPKSYTCKHQIEISIEIKERKH
jgi:hypothetical protein